MDNSFTGFYTNWNQLSWKKSYNNLFRVQFRLFKSVLVANKSLAFSFQNILFSSTSIFLIAIREVTQLDIFRRLSGIDGKLYLNFADRFELVSLLKINLSSWLPSKIKKIFITRKNGSFVRLGLFSISDRCWQTVIKYSLFPAHEAFFSYRNFGYRFYNNVFDLQNIIFLNLSQFYSFQKRIFLFNFRNCVNKFNYNYFLSKLYIPRRFKLVVFRFLKLGFTLEFFAESGCLDFSSFLANILFSEIDFLHPSVRYGYDLMFFLKPLENEIDILQRVNICLSKLGIDLFYTSKILSSEIGFNFSDWSYVLSYHRGLICTPGFDNYQAFLRRVKRVINNSNYGSNIKSLKLFPIIRDWYYYNRFTNTYFLKLSLFFIKKRAFKIFNSESKQDRYSSKVLIDKCFNFVLLNKTVSEKNDFFITTHISFCFFNLLNVRNLSFSEKFSVEYLNFFYCIHCGKRMT